MSSTASSWMSVQTQGTFFLSKSYKHLLSVKVYGYISITIELLPGISWDDLSVGDGIEFIAEIYLSNARIHPSLILCPTNSHSVLYNIDFLRFNFNPSPTKRWNMVSTFFKLSSQSDETNEKSSAYKYTKLSPRNILCDMVEKSRTVT